MARTKYAPFNRNEFGGIIDHLSVDFVRIIFDLSRTDFVGVEFGRIGPVVLNHRSLHWGTRYSADLGIDVHTGML